LPLGLAAARANVSEQDWLVPALEDIPLEVPEGTPGIAAKGREADALRDALEARGFEPSIPHCQNRVKPSRNDGRRWRRYGHRWLVERTKVWLHCCRGLAVRWCFYSFTYVVLIYLSFIHVALQRF
jgi:transposase